MKIYEIRIRKENYEIETFTFRAENFTDVAAEMYKLLNMHPNWAQAEPITEREAIKGE